MLNKHYEMLLPWVRALLFLSYPLHPPNKPNQVRDAILYPLLCPALFVFGGKDGFYTPKIYEQVKQKKRKQKGPEGLVTFNEVILPLSNHSLYNRKSDCDHALAAQIIPWMKSQTD